MGFAATFISAPLVARLGVLRVSHSFITFSSPSAPLLPLSAPLVARLGVLR